MRGGEKPQKHTEALAGSGKLLNLRVTINRERKGALL